MLWAGLCAAAVVSRVAVCCWVVGDGDRAGVGPRFRLYLAFNRGWFLYSLHPSLVEGRAGLLMLSFGLCPRLLELVPSGSVSAAHAAGVVTSWARRLPAAMSASQAVRVVMTT